MGNKQNNNQSQSNKKGNKNNQNYRKDNRQQNQKPPKDNNKPEDKNKSCNDFSWYNKNPQLINSAAKISFGNVAGLSLPIGEGVNADNTAIPKTYLPGIMKIKLHPSFGISVDATSELNNASRILYAWVRHVNSGSRNYEQADYFTYIMACSSLYSFYMEMVRLYGMLVTYSKENRFIGEKLVTAMGYDYAGLSTQIADLRYYINQYAIKVNSLAIPKNISLFDRQMTLPFYIFKDSNNNKSQLYAFQYDTYYQWSFTDPDGVASSSLKPVKYVANTLARIRNFGDSLIDSMLLNEDVGIMSGDTIKAFKDNLHILPELPENATLTIRYDENILSQIHNMYIFGAIAENSDWVTQSGNNLIFNPYKEGVVSELYDINQLNLVIDSGMDDPSVEFVAEATRLVTVPKYKEGNTYIESVGSEIVTQVEFYDFSRETAKASLNASFVTSDGTDSLLSLFTNMCHFDWSPLLYVYSSLSESNGIMLFGDTFNVTVPGNYTLQKIHTACLLSLLDVSGITTTS